MLKVSEWEREEKEASVRQGLMDVRALQRCLVPAWEPHAACSPSDVVWINCQQNAVHFHMCIRHDLQEELSLGFIHFEPVLSRDNFPLFLRS